MMHSPSVIAISVLENVMNESNREVRRLEAGLEKCRPALQR